MAAARSLSSGKYVYLTTAVDPQFAAEVNRFCRQYGGTRARSHIIRTAIRALMADPPRSGLALPSRVLLDGAPTRSARRGR